MRARSGASSAGALLALVASTGCSAIFDGGEHLASGPSPDVDSGRPPGRDAGPGLDAGPPVMCTNDMMCRGTSPLAYCDLSMNKCEFCDLDGDTYPSFRVECPSRFSAFEGDCDDGNPSVHPDVALLCDDGLAGCPELDDATSLFEATGLNEVVVIAPTMLDENTLADGQQISVTAIAAPPSTAVNAAVTYRLDTISARLLAVKLDTASPIIVTTDNLPGGASAAFDSLTAIGMDQTEGGGAFIGLGGIIAGSPGVQTAIYPDSGASMGVAFGAMYLRSFPILGPIAIARDLDDARPQMFWREDPGMGTAALVAHAGFDGSLGIEESSDFRVSATPSTAIVGAALPIVLVESISSGVDLLWDGRNSSSFSEYLLATGGFAPRLGEGVRPALAYLQSLGSVVVYYPSADGYIRRTAPCTVSPASCPDTDTINNTYPDQPNLLAAASMRIQGTDFPVLALRRFDGTTEHVELVFDGVPGRFASLSAITATTVRDLDVSAYTDKLGVTTVVVAAAVQNGGRDSIWIGGLRGCATP